MLSGLGAGDVLDQRLQVGLLAGAGDDLGLDRLVAQLLVGQQASFAADQFVQPGRSRNLSLTRIGLSRPDVVDALDVHVELFFVPVAGVDHLDLVDRDLFVAPLLKGQFRAWLSMGSPPFKAAVAERPDRCGRTVRSVWKSEAEAKRVVAGQPSRQGDVAEDLGFVRARRAARPA